MAITHREIISDIKKGTPAPFYLLMGNESYYLDLIAESLEANVVTLEDRDFNLSVFYGNDSDPDYIVRAAQQFPVMADKKLVILKEAQTMDRAKSQLDKFAPYVRRPVPSTVFAIVYKGDALPKTSELIKAAKESGAVVFTATSPRDYQLGAVLKDYCTSRKKAIEEKACEMLCQYVGLPLSKLFGEVNKLITIIGEGTNRITATDVEKHIGVSKDFNNFELVNAVARKDYPKAVRIVRYFRDNPKNNPTVMTTSTLFNYFSNLVGAQYEPDKSDRSLMEALGFKAPVQLRDIREGMKNYSPAQAVKAVHHLREFDAQSKGVGSLQNEYVLLSELLFKIFT